MGAEGMDGTQSTHPAALAIRSTDRQVWGHLGLFESEAFCEQTIRRRAGTSPFDPDLLKRKARGVAYCVRNAKGYFKTPPEADYNSRFVGAYYGLMWFVSAALICDPTTPYDLEKLEATTAQGHGLGNALDDTSHFPQALNVYVKSDGFFVHYLRYLGVDVDQLKVKGHNRVARFSEDERPKLVSLKDLIARIPEVASLYALVLGEHPLNTAVTHSDHNMRDEDTAAAVFGPPPGLRMRLEAERKEPPKSARNYVCITGDPSLLTAEFITTTLGLPLDDLHICKSIVPEGEDPEEYWCGSIEVPTGKYWHDLIPWQRSPMAPTSWVKPLFTAKANPILVYLITLYGLSILVRYLPRLWREVRRGVTMRHFRL